MMFGRVTSAMAGQGYGAIADTLRGGRTAPTSWSNQALPLIGRRRHAPIHVAQRPDLLHGSLQRRSHLGGVDAEARRSRAHLRSSDSADASLKGHRLNDTLSVVAERIDHSRPDAERLDRLCLRFADGLSGPRARRDGGVLQFASPVGIADDHAS